MEPVEIEAAEVPAIEQEELWQVIDMFATYSVSNLGRVRNDQTGRVLRQSDNGRGYNRVMLYNQGRGTNCLVHRLVVQQFIGLIPEGFECDHIDRNRTNNAVSNLHIVSSSENQRNRAAYGRRAVDYVDELPADAEPLIEAHGRAVAAGHYRHNRDYYVQIGRQYRRLTHTRIRNSWQVSVRGPNGEHVTINWTD
jgi:hypothetical protein